MKILKTISLLCGGMFLAAASLSSCGDSNDPKPDDSNTPTVDAKDLDYSAENAKSWGNYAVAVANLLATDSKSLYDSWNESYEGGVAFKDIFKNHNTSSYGSAVSCIEQILDGCADIANEVGTSKIGDPYTLYKESKTEEALYAVESWYSWHSRDDYSNNILSIRNSYFGSLDNTVAANSISALVKSLDADLDTRAVAAITEAYNAILNIPQPFRNNIVCMESEAAQDACEVLENLIDKELKPLLSGLDASYDSRLDAIVTNYVDNVVLPTYKDLAEKNAALLASIQAFAKTPSNKAFEDACNAWLVSREPWEKSEAFLFGPVDALGLDPNMDSWPLDQDAIVNHINSGNFDDLHWGEGDDEEKVEAAQNVRGFHTLEFLLFKNGQPRKVN